MSWRHLHSYPPIKVRLFARRKVAGPRADGPGTHVRGLTNAEIAIASGLDLDRVAVIAFLTSWDSVSVAEAERFCLACHFDPMSSADRNRWKAYERKCQKTPPPQRFLWMRRTPTWREELLPLIEKLKRLPPKSPGLTSGTLQS